MELPKTVTDWLKHTGAIVAIVLIALGVLMHVRSQHAYQKQVTDLQNQLALKDKTVEEQKGVFEKRALITDSVLGNLQSLMNDRDQQVKELQDQLKKSGEQLQSAVATSVYWKQAYQGAANASQKTTPPTTPNTPGRDEVDFNQDFGYIGVKGWTKTNPAEAYVSVFNLRPLKLTVAVSQDKTKAWHSYVTSSEENVSADIAVSAVNPYLEEPKWYEKLALRGDLGVGSTDAGAGVLLGLGATFELGRFDVGPAGWFAISNRVDRYLGVMVGYHPFQRQ